MKQIIAFDMDGTIADLYSVNDLFSKAEAEDPSPYKECKPLVNMSKLNQVCALLQKAGYEIQVITALWGGASPEYKKVIREAKKAWLDKWGFIYDHFHAVDYKTRKSDVIRRDMKEGDNAILIDDEERHTSKWKWGKTIDPTKNDLIDALIALLPEDLQ